MHRPRKTIAVLVKLVNFKNWLRPSNTIVNFVSLEKSSTPKHWRAFSAAVGNTKNKTPWPPRCASNARRVPNGLQYQLRALYAIPASTMNKTKPTYRVANYAVLENTTIDKDNLLAKTIAMLVPTSTLIKPLA